jgi:UDP-N-acetylmuramoyl-tripeptide--D-alanyl-D-alanine ligase
MNLTLETCAAWMSGEFTGKLSGNLNRLPELEATSYSIDTRTLVPGALFFAVSGDRFDAHAFVPGAIAAGSVAAVVAKDKLTPELLQYPLIAVDDPLVALQRLGAAVRGHWHGTLIGLTGSAGKTTTKDMVAAVLSAKHNVLKSAGNLNNHFGVPLQLLRLQTEHDYAVIEMGMSNAGEIALLATLAAPDWAVVTNVGMAHAQNFPAGPHGPGGIEGIALAKRELVDALDPATGIAFLNGDDPRVAAFAQSFPGRSILVGTRTETTPVAAVKTDTSRFALQAVSVTQRGLAGLTIEVESSAVSSPHSDVDPGTHAPALQSVHLQLLGAQNATNALLALAVGLQAGVSLAEGAAALAHLTPGDRRGEVLTLNNATLINDCYNSNPAALSAMVDTLMQIPATRHIVIAGEMLELGPQSPQLHAACGRQAAQAGAAWVIGVQGSALALVEAAAASGASALFFPTALEAGAWLSEALRPGDAVLLKGSRGVGLERALPPFTVVAPAPPEQ